LPDLYAVIAFFLQHRGAVENYLAEQAQAAQQARREVENGLASSDLRERLKKRRARAAA
jgi:hypothetical protein